MNIYQMYMANEYKFGFYVHRNSWHPNRKAKVTWIEFVIEGKPIKGDPPYFGGFKYPPGHPKASKTMSIRLVKLEADWLDNGELIIRTGGNYAWSLVK